MIDVRDDVWSLMCDSSGTNKTANAMEKVVDYELLVRVHLSIRGVNAARFREMRQSIKEELAEC